MSGRVIVIGDVHGCIDELQRLIDHLRPGVGDRVICTGDIVNRGPDSRSVLALLSELGAQSVIGNHERRLLQYHATSDPAVLKRGDAATVQQLLPMDWLTLASLPLTIHVPEHNLLIVHGGFLPGTQWRDQPADLVTTLQMVDADGSPRKRGQSPTARPWADFWSGPEFVVYGHTPRPHPYRKPLSIGIDTGCVYGGSLTAIVFPERQLFQVPARRTYFRKQGGRPWTRP